MTGKNDDVKQSLVWWKEILEWYIMRMNKSKTKVMAIEEKHCELNIQIADNIEQIPRGNSRRRRKGGNRNQQKNHKSYQVLLCIEQELPK